MIRRRLALTDILQIGGPVASRRPRAADLFSISGKAELRVHECYWSDNTDPDNSLPVVVFPADNDLETFFADAVTFHSDLVPISAQFHVLNSDLRHLLVEVGSSKPAGRSSKNHQSVLARRKLLVSLAIVEATSELLASGEEPDYLPYAVSRRTLSFALARGAELYPSYAPARIASRCIQLRQLTGIKVLPEVYAAITRIVDFVANPPPPLDHVVGDESSLLDVRLYELLNKETSDNYFAEYLSQSYGGLADYRRVYSGAFDGRMNAFQNIVDVIGARSRGDLFDSVAISFFCNAILPGSLTHIELLTRMLHIRPTILVWYGFFAGISENFDWRSVGNGIGQKLSRDIQATFAIENPPVADISLDELTVLQEIDAGEKLLKPVQRRAMLVSVLPGIDIFSRIAVEGDRQPSSRGMELDFVMRERSEAKNREIRRLLEQAQALLSEDLSSPDSPRVAKSSDNTKSSRRKSTGRFYK